MKQPFHLSAQARKQGKPFLVTAGLVLTGWLGGTMLLGAIEAPDSLHAMDRHQSGLSASVGQPAMNPSGFADIAKMVRPAVVNITVQKDVHEITKEFGRMPFDQLPDFFGEKFYKGPVPPPQMPEEPSMGSGSGVIISSDGYVVTNNHVVDGAKLVTVTLVDKREFDGKIVGADPETDIAVVKIEGKNLPHLKWADSHTLQIGDYVLAVGNPFGLNSTVTQGIVSALGRGGMGITQYEDFIQTDAAINPGNSGGALVNMKGELVGINTAIFSRTGGYQGVGFAVPADMAQSVVTSLVKDGRVVRGFLGIGIQEVTVPLAETLGLKEPKGALVTEIKSGSPAEKAGIQRSDAIIEYEGQAIEGPRALQKAVTRTPVGKSVSLKVVRDGHQLVLEPTIRERSQTVQVAEAQTDSEAPGLAGVSVKPVGSVNGRQWGIRSSAKGVVVTEVQPGTAADRAGLTRGDVIREVNKKEIETLDDYQAAAKELKKDQHALLLIERGGVPLFLTIKA